MFYWNPTKVSIILNIKIIHSIILFLFRVTRPKGNVPVVGKGRAHIRYYTTPAHQKQYVPM